MPQTSPKQQLSPQYSTVTVYNTDSENIMDPVDQEIPQGRYPIRRQSTLPCRPNEHHGSAKYLSTSPNRSPFSRSPEKSDTDQPRYPPFVRQSTFPSNSSDPYHSQRSKILPTSPNRLQYNKSPEISVDSTDHTKRYPIIRQATLPNPDQHLKLLPTSPPKKQLSPSYMKRSPEFARQNTLPNPDAMNSLSMHQHGAKFLPISPRQKQNFLFPQPQNPRPFLSQQNFPTMIDDPNASPGGTLHHNHHQKMIKVRSHSNEEYSISRSIAPMEGRRLLPEIPRNRSPSRLVRQDHVKEDQQRSPVKKTFSEAKQNLMEYNNDPNLIYCDNSSIYDYNNEPKQTYNEEDEDNENDAQIELDIKIKSNIRSAESFLNDSSPEYFHPEEYIRAVRKDRTRRRRSKELIEHELVISSNEDEPPKRRPDQMRSISEDTGSNKCIKPVTRRSLSHPEKDSVSLFFY